MKIQSHLEVTQSHTKSLKITYTVFWHVEIYFSIAFKYFFSVLGATLIFNSSVILKYNDVDDLTEVQLMLIILNLDEIWKTQSTCH